MTERKRLIDTRHQLRMLQVLVADCAGVPVGQLLVDQVDTLANWINGLVAAPAQEPEWDAPPPPMKVDGSGASIARYAAPAQEPPADQPAAPSAIPCNRCMFPAGCKAHGQCRNEYDAAPAQEPPAEPTQGEGE